MMAPPKIAARAMSVSEIKIFFLRAAFRAAPVRRFALVTADAAGGGAGTAGEENTGDGGAAAREGDAAEPDVLTGGRADGGAGGGATWTTAPEKVFCGRDGPR